MEKTYRKIECCECRNFVPSNWFNKHLDKHSLTLEQYAWKHHTEQIKKCVVCQKEFFTSTRKNNKCCSKECRHKAISESSIRTNKNRSRESYCRGAKNANKKKKENKEFKQREFGSIPTMRINLSQLPKCDSCNRRFKNVCALANHQTQSEKCRRIDKYFCKIPNCNCRFNNVVALNNHYNRDHTEEEIIKKIFNGEQPKCKCRCGKHTKRIRDEKIYNDYVNGHNAIGREVSQETREKLSKSSHKQWESLTKEERVEKCALCPAWNTGLTKETDERLVMLSEHLKETNDKKRAAGIKLGNPLFGTVIQAMTTTTEVREKHEKLYTRNMADFVIFVQSSQLSRKNFLGKSKLLFLMI